MSNSPIRSHLDLWRTELKRRNLFDRVLIVPGDVFHGQFISTQVQNLSASCTFSMNEEHRLKKKGLENLPYEYVQSHLKRRFLTRAEEMYRKLPPISSQETRYLAFCIAEPSDDETFFYVQHEGESVTIKTLTLSFCLDVFNFSIKDSSK